MKSQNLQLEKELLLNAQNDSKKFAELYKYFINDVYRFSYSMLNNKHDAEDISSQTFLKFYQNLENYEWKNLSIKYWLFRVARNLCYDKFRLPKEIELNDDINPVIIAELSFIDGVMNNDFVEEIMKKDLIKRIKEEIQKLSSIEQEIINLRIWEGMQFEEIAEIQEMKLNTCKSYFYRSIEKLKKSVEEKNYMRGGFSFPLLLSGIEKVSELPNYQASFNLINYANSIILGKTTMTTMPTITNIGAFLASKVGITALTTIVAGTVAITGTTVYLNNNQNQNNTNNSQTVAQVTNTPMATITISPTANVTTTPTSTPTSTPIPTQVIQNGIIEGELLFPSSYIPDDLTVCAEDINTKKTICTSNHIKNSKYNSGQASGQGFKIEVPAGRYYVYATTSAMPGIKAYHSAFTVCGITVACESKSNSPLAVDVKSGQTVGDIRPWNFY